MIFWKELRTSDSPSVSNVRMKSFLSFTLKLVQYFISLFSPVMELQSSTTSPINRTLAPARSWCAWDCVQWPTTSVSVCCEGQVVSKDCIGVAKNMHTNCEGLTNYWVLLWVAAIKFYQNGLTYLIICSFWFLMCLFISFKWCGIF